MQRIIAFFIALFVLTALLAPVVWAAPTERQGVGRMLLRGDDKPQGFSPNGLYTNDVATNATFHDLTNYLAAAVFCSVTCYGRLTPTAAKGAYKKFTIPANSWFSIIKNTASPFWNISTSTGTTHEFLPQ